VRLMKNCFPDFNNLVKREGKKQQERERERERYAVMLVIAFLLRYYPTPISSGAFSSSLSSFLLDLFTHFVSEIEENEGKGKRKMGGEKESKEKETKEEREETIVIPAWFHPLLYSLLTLLRSPLSIYAPSCSSFSPSSPFSLSEHNLQEQLFVDILCEKEREKGAFSPFSSTQKHNILEKTLSFLSFSCVSSPSHINLLLLWLVAVLSFSPSLLSLIATETVLCNILYVDAVANHGKPPTSIKRHGPIEYIFKHLLQDKASLSLTFAEEIQRSFEGQSKMTVDQFLTTHRQTALRSPSLFVMVSKHFCRISGILDDSMKPGQRQILPCPSPGPFSPFEDENKKEKEKRKKEKNKERPPRRKTYRCHLPILTQYPPPQTPPPHPLLPPLFSLPTYSFVWILQQSITLAVGVDCECIGAYK